MITIDDVANYFLSRQGMTHKKLQKLCYYAQAWHCALVGEPLFSDEFQAWVHGPVSPTLFKKYHEFKWQKIKRLVGFDAKKIFAPESLDVLKRVYSTFKKFNGDQLENMACHDEPWRDARGSLKPLESGYTPLSTNLMRDFYARQYDKARND